MNRLSFMAWLLFLAMLAGFHAQAQMRRSCASNDYLLQQLASDPDMVIRRQNLENFTQQYVQDQSLNNNKTTNALYSIPVVVHVLYNNATANISAAQIQSQIDVLNQDFQKLNADVTSTPAAFAGVVADCQIQFCLAQRDPQGNASTGIVRVPTTKSSFSTSSDDAKYTSTGGDDAWPAGQYLNLWVVPALNGNVLGYAQFPGGPAASDGVVITNSCFGNIGTAAAPFDKGRTATHEVGHWLNLYHIWGDDGNACSGSDLVGDTPNQADENYNCPTFPTVSCSNGPNGDMFMNYMDYTDDACMFMFSNGQKTRMQAIFASGGPRFSITTSLGCVPPVASCTVPAGLSVSNINSAGVDLNWSAVPGAAGYSLQWKPAGGAWVVVPMANISGTSYTLTGLAASSSYSFRVRTRCGTTYTAYSAAHPFSTSGASACATPVPGTVTPMTAVSATLNWSAVSGAADYNLQWKPGSATAWTTVSHVNGTSFNLTGLTGNTPYDYRLQTNCTAGTTAPYSTVNSFTTVTAPCNVPSGLGVSGITGSSAVLNWTGVSGVTGYSLQWKAAGGSWTVVPVSAITGSSYSLTGLAPSSAYSFRVRTKCGATYTAYSTAFNFSTTGCSDIFESNNTRPTAKYITTNVNQSGMIGTATDLDWFKFVNTASSPNIRITLTTLPFDYDLALYHGSTLLGTSDLGGTANELIVYNTAVVDTYYIRVKGYNGAFSSTLCYTLKAEISNTTFREAEPALSAKEEPGETMTLYPNPATSSVSFEYVSASRQDASVMVVDQAGRLGLKVPVHLEEGANNAKIDVSGMAPGFYFVRLITASGSITAKLMIQR